MKYRPGSIDEVTQRAEIWKWLKESGGKTSTELHTGLGLSKSRAIRVLREMLALGCATREEAGLNQCNGITYRYFAAKEPPGKGNHPRGVLLPVRFVRIERGYTKTKIQSASARRQNIALSRYETMPVVRL